MKHSGIILTVLGALCWSPLNAADFRCEYQDFTDTDTGLRFDYTCLNGQELPVNDATITKVIGDHRYKDELKTVLYTNADVEIVEIYSETISQIPKGLITVFPKLTKLIIVPKLPNVTRIDFAELKQLQKLEISVNYLAANIFDDLINLKELTLEKSELTFLPNLIFQKLPELELIKVVGGSTLRKINELPANLFQSNLKLREITFKLNGLTCIRDGLFNGLVYLEAVSFDNICIKADYPAVDLPVINNQIHTNCQSTCVISPIPVVTPPIAVVTPLPPIPVVTSLPPTPVVTPLPPIPVVTSLPPYPVVVSTLLPPTPTATPAVTPCAPKVPGTSHAAGQTWNPLVSVQVIVN
ncbi:unnamed protein product [Diamesa hyperborea]